MKNKSTRHKETNIFKFQPFAERIANIDIDIFHRIGHENEADNEEAECYFHQSVENWSILNLTESFGSFKKEVKAHTLVTLPQLILDKERVVEVLLKHLRLRNPLSLQPLLDIVVAVAKDLRKDFYQYHEEFFQVLIDLLNTKDTEQLEWTFTCLAYLFKFLWRPLLKDITRVFNTLLPLLSSTKPDYINSFAAGSFAFVARKVKDWPTFLQHILKTVKLKKDGVEGCGKLFFEVIHGVSGQFHSCAETILPFLFDSLSNSKFSQKTLFEIMEQMIANIVANIQPQKSGLLWDCLVANLDNLVKNWKNSREEKVAVVMELTLKLLGQSIEHRQGRLLLDYNPVIQAITSVLNNPDLPESVLLAATQICILLLLAKNVKLSQEQASGITRKVLSLPKESILLYFVENVSDFSAFEALILPTFLKYCASTKLNDECWSVLTRLVLKKAPLVESGINLDNWVKYPIEFGSNEIVERLNVENFDYYISSLICLPHLNLDNNLQKIIEILIKNCENFLIKIEGESDKSSLKKLLFLLNGTVECIVHLNQIHMLSRNFNSMIDALLPLTQKWDCISALKTLDLVITASEDDRNINFETLLKLNRVLASNFSSPYHEIRLLTSHLYTFFEKLPEFSDLKHSSDPDIPKENFALFSICYRVESVDPQVHTYRDQLQNLDRLNFDKPQIIMCQKTDFKTVPLRYLCGSLYINFKLLWGPVSKIIETHAHGLGPSDFWEVYREELKGVVGRIRDKGEVKCDVITTKWPFLEDLYRESHKLSTKPDFINYRLLLWKAMDLFADIAEAKTRDVSELFLDFMEKEYNKNDSDVAIKWNIKQNSEILEEAGDDQNKQNSKPKRGKAHLQTLQAFLAVFSKIRSPKSMYREPELNKLYFDFLQHKNSQVQKLALDCIMTYKHKYLTPYKDNLYNLIDDKQFKNELATFQIDKDTSAIQQEHREDLIPLIMKIVFSKMNVKTGGKSSGQLRRNLVLRFLAGCEENEMLTFIKMALRYYTKHLDDDPEVMVDNLKKSIDLENFIPPKRLQSTMNLINVILEQFGGLMGNDLLTFILQILLIIGGALREAFQEIANVHGGYLSILKTLRASSIKIVERFFEQFDRYPWTNKQINAIFTVFVWPYLAKLNVEGIHRPTSLLKLFVQWGSNPRYFPLLVKHESDNENQFALPHVIQLLLNEKSHATVVNAIEEMLEKMLTLQSEDDDLSIDNRLPVAQHILDRIKVDEKLNYGSCILLPYVPQILEKIKTKLGKNLNQKELLILARISELVWESDISDSTLRLLLPIVSKRCSASFIGEEVVVQLLTTVKNLISHVTNPGGHLKLISPLFGQVSFASGRKILVGILKTVTETDLIEGLNAFDQKWVDQPDFQRRHDTFKDIQLIIESEKVELELGILIIYNCYYLLKSEKDLSLKENSLHCLKKIVPCLIRKYPKESNYLLNETVLTLIRNGMKSSNYDFRNDCVQLLGHFSRECPDSHVVFRDLSLYTNRNDLEVDFFENITHLQLHRHARALLKFCSVTRELEISPNIRSLTQFILPLASFYLCNEKYVGKNSVIDAAIECIGVVCRILPWHQYESILKYYLMKLRNNVDYQKQLVRLTVTILDAFHFDLSKSQSGEVPEVEAIEDKEDENVDIDEAIDPEDKTDEDVEEAVTERVKICEKVPILCKSTATRVTRMIQIVLLPKLHNALAQLTHHDTSHKINRKKTSFEREEEDLSRVPISLALVKLLQRLPKEILEANLPGIFMKLCTFLKSHLESVRRVTRETLQKIMQSLGPDYLHLLLVEMTPLLNRGFHVHVLVFTVHAVLSCLKDSYKPTHIDKVLLTVLQLCQADLFGSLSEEKEVAKIAVKTSEAKTTKSFDTFQILAQFITDKCLTDLILPIKNVIQASHSHKTVHKAQECLRHVALGLVDNNFVQIQSLLIFAYGTASESIPELITKEKSAIVGGKLKIEKPDCFIIPKPMVGRSGVRVTNVKSSTKTNAHLLVEFGLRLCFVLLKRDKLKDEDYKAFLDPFVAIFKNCLNSKHVKLSTLTLQCLSWVLKYDLPSLREHIKDITKDMFATLHKYASATLSKGDNFDLVVAAFKAVAVLVRDVKYHTVDTEQLKMLLLYAEQDMHDHDRQATAFALLKAIISRKLLISEVHEVMKKVAELSITSELGYIRAQARAVFHQYLMDYPLGDKLERHLTFYLSQLSYELQFGRESAIEMINCLISSFPKKTLKDHSGTLFVSMGARLVNDEVPECRKQIAEGISSMLARLGKRDSEPLFEIVTVWLKESKISHRRLAVQLCGIFVSVEKVSFESKLPKLLPIILKQFVTKSKDDEEDEEYERVRDHHLFQLLQMLLKVCAHCPSFLRMKEVEDLSRHVQGLLGYPHDWVRLSAAQFIGYVLSASDIEQVARLLADNKKGESGYLEKEPAKAVKALTLDLCDQLQVGNVKSDLAEQVIKNLVFVARVLQKVEIKENEEKKINLLWLTKKMRKIVNCEVVENSTSTVLRTEVFKWIAAVSTVLDLESITPIINHLLAPLVREMITTEESNAPLRQLAKEVGGILKKRIGVEEYTKTLSSLQQLLSVKRAERKRARTQLAVTDPEMFAKKKLKRHEKKKDAKKRKIAEMKGKKSFKRRKVVDMDPEAEVM